MCSKNVISEITVLTPTESTMTMMNLPIEMIDKILSYMSYDQIAKLRSVNRTFNSICSDKLNKGFYMVEQLHTKCLKAVKTKLPRRESERRHHPLSRHSDILMAVETRLSMLSMTFSKYIEARQCCFIPGKVLDEALKVLRIISYSSIPSTAHTQYPFLPRPHDFLQEYRDVSSMAMEHFDDKILPAIRERMKLESPRLYCFKNRPVVVSGRAHLLGIHSMKMPLSRSSSNCVTFFPTSLDSAENNKNGQSEGMSVPATKICKVLRHTEAKYNRTKKFVLKLHCNVKKMKIQNSLLKRQLNQQNIMIKQMKKEIRDTKNCMSIMKKDLNRFKIEQPSSKEQTASDRPVCSNLSVQVTSSLSLPQMSESSLYFRGIKRKRDQP